MASLNKACLIGHCGRDPEVRYMQNGNAVANLSLATSETWKDKSSGDKKEATEWHRCVFFDRLAEVVNQYVKKGSLIYVEGKLKTRKWTDKDGSDKYTTEIHCHEMKLLSSRQDGGQPAQREERPADKPAQRSSAPDPFDDENIPFANPYRGAFLHMI